MWIRPLVDWVDLIPSPVRQRTRELRYPALQLASRDLEVSWHRIWMGVLTGVLRAVQTLPATMENLVARSTGGRSGPGTPAQHDSVEYASVRSSAERGLPPPPPATAAQDPLFDVPTLVRMQQMQEAAPLLYPATPLEFTGPRQLTEVMAVRDEESRRLRAQVEALSMENHSLRMRAEFESHAGYEAPPQPPPEPILGNVPDSTFVAAAGPNVSAIPKAPAAVTSLGGPGAQGLDPMTVVLSGMAQLQSVVQEMASPKNTQKPEVIKPGVVSLPELPPHGPESCLSFADWLHASKPALADISDTSETLWTTTIAEAQEWYAGYLKLDPLGRLTAKPKASDELEEVDSASLQIDLTPDDEKVRKFHAQLLGELEAIAHRGDKDKGTRDPPSPAPAKVKGVEAPAPNPPPPKKPPKSPPKAPSNAKAGSQDSTSAAKAPCSFYVGHNGCKKGADCAYEHDWNGFSTSEKAARCKVCGSKTHKAVDCKAGAKPEEAKGKAPPASDANQQQIKSLLADAAWILQQSMPTTQSPGVESVPTVPATPVPAQPLATQAQASSTAPVQGTPVTLASLSAQLDTLRGLSRDPEIRVIKGPEVLGESSEVPGLGVGVSVSMLRAQLDALRKAVEIFETKVQTKDDRSGSGGVALLDSGATHAVISFHDRLQNLEPVPVTLAGDERQEWLRTEGGTLVIPPSREADAPKSSQTILPLGALVETLGCQDQRVDRFKQRVQNLECQLNAFDQIELAESFPVGSSETAKALLKRVTHSASGQVKGECQFSVWISASRAEGVVEFSQGALGGEFLRPTALITNLDLSYLSSLKPCGSPLTPPGGRAWTIQLRTALVKVLSGNYLGPPYEVLDREISCRIKGQSVCCEPPTTNAPSVDPEPLEADLEAQALRRSFEEDSDLDCDLEEDVLIEELCVKEIEGDSPAPASGENPKLDPKELGMSSAELEGWKQHLSNGHLPYRRDCRQCVEGSGLGVFHKRVRFPKSFALSVDLFGPVPLPEAGRDEGCVTGKSILRYGLVGAFRVPRSVIQLSSGPDGIKDLFKGETPEAPPARDELAEYEPSNASDELFPELFASHPDAKRQIQEEQGSVPDAEVKSAETPEVSVWDSGDLPEDPGELASLIKELNEPVDQVVLRYFIPLRTKSGVEVAEALQRMILGINQRFPVRSIHHDPGTEFGSAALSKWLANHGVRVQHSLPTDKRANGLAERTVGWIKSRIRTLLNGAGLSVGWWPLAARWAVAKHNRNLLGEPDLPAFGQRVLHRVKQPADGTKQLMERWIEAQYAAPHRSIPDGHVLINAAGNLVASRGFRSHVIDPTKLPDLQPPLLQEEDAGEPVDTLMNESGVPLKRLRDKTSVRFLECLESPTSEEVAHELLISQDLSLKGVHGVLSAFAQEEESTGDRRGIAEGKYVLGAYCHGGLRGVTGLTKRKPWTTRLLNTVLASRVSACEGVRPTWSALMLMRAGDVEVHRDWRNEWGTLNFVMHVPGEVQLWVEPEESARVKGGVLPNPTWCSQETRALTEVPVAFNARRHHAVRMHQNWLIVGYTPLGTGKLPQGSVATLEAYEFPMPCPTGLQGQTQSERQPGQAETRTIAPQLRDEDKYRVQVLSTSSEDMSESSIDSNELRRQIEEARLLEGSPQSDEDSGPLTVQEPLSNDLQPDISSPLIGWDFSSGNPGDRPHEALENVELADYLTVRGAQQVYRQLRALGIEVPNDLQFLFVEDLIEHGIPEWLAVRTMQGIHPPGRSLAERSAGMSLRRHLVQIQRPDYNHVMYMQEMWGDEVQSSVPAVGSDDIPEETSADPTTDPMVQRVDEGGFTPNVEDLLSRLEGPLEATHNVAPAEVRQNLAKWRPAAQAELSTFEAMGVIRKFYGGEARAILRSSDYEVIPGKPVCTVKPGEPYKRKFRIVSCGNYAKTTAESQLYAGGAGAESLRALLAHSARRGRRAYGLDVKSAFLLASIPDGVTKRYTMRPPRLLIELGLAREDEVWIIDKALYGFRESPRWWSLFRDDFLARAEWDTPLGKVTLEQFSSESNVWRMRHENGLCIGHLLVYVDDMLLLTEPEVAQSFIDWLRQSWECTGLKEATASDPLRFLGVDIYAEENDAGDLVGYSLAQESYIAELLRSHDVKPNPRATSPVPKEWVRELPQEEEFSEAELRASQRITGELLWVAQRSRVDISYCVGLMASWVADVSEAAPNEELVLREVMLSAT
ncbi:GIP [Symbiodinium sp. CCMP2592]|nr:GIP [Symbiodinium sp. CCMP2592]